MEITIYRDGVAEWEEGNTIGTRDTNCADVVDISQGVVNILLREDEESNKQLEKIIRGLKGM